MYRLRIFRKQKQINILSVFCFSKTAAYCRFTPTEWVPFLIKVVSSTDSIPPFALSCCESSCWYFPRSLDSSNGDLEKTVIRSGWIFHPENVMQSVQCIYALKIYYIIYQNHKLFLVYIIHFFNFSSSLERNISTN